MNIGSGLVRRSRPQFLVQGSLWPVWPVEVNVGASISYNRLKPFYSTFCIRDVSLSHQYYAPTHMEPKTHERWTSCLPSLMQETPAFRHELQDGILPSHCQTDKLLVSLAITLGLDVRGFSVADNACRRPDSGLFSVSPFVFLHKLK